MGRVFSKPKLRHLKRIAIDEISIGTGHRYVTIVLDLESGAIVHVGLEIGLQRWRDWQSCRERKQNSTLRALCKNEHRLT